MENILQTMCSIRKDFVKTDGDRSALEVLQGCLKFT